MRNYKNEAKWAKEKYGRIEVKINKELIKEFKEQLKYYGFTITEFFEDRIKKFLERNNLLVKVNRLESQIDLMAEYIATLDIDEDICMNNKINSEWCNEDYTNCKKCIKQYFERKVEE